MNIVVAPTLSARTRGGGGLGTDFDCDCGLVANSLRAQPNASHRDDSDNYVVAHSLRGEGFDASEDSTGRGTPLIPVVAPTLRAGGNSTGGNRPYGTDVDTCDSLIPVHPYTLAIRGRGDSHELEYRQDGTANAILTPNGGRGGVGVGAVAFDLQQITSAANRSRVAAGLPAPTMAKHSDMHVATEYAVRRLIPLECERLQGFPDRYTDIEFRAKRAADGNRFKALGNSMAVNVMRWIGDRIQMIENLTNKDAA